MAALKNAKHEHFAQLVSNGESATRAYVLAGYSENGAGQNGGRLMMNDEISSRLAQLRAAKEAKHDKAATAIIVKAAIDKAWVLNQLVENVRMGKQADPILDGEGNPTGEYRQNLPAANVALGLIGKELGMFIDRKEIRTGELDGLGGDELKQLRDALLFAITPGQTASAEPKIQGGATH